MVYLMTGAEYSISPGRIDDIVSLVIDLIMDE